MIFTIRGANAKDTLHKLFHPMVKTRKREFLDQMERAVPWAELETLIAPYYLEGRTGRPVFSLETMLRTRFVWQWFTLDGSAMEDAFFDTPLYREFA